MTRAWLIGCAVLSGVIGLSAMRSASLPSAGTISPATTNVTWSGGPYTGATADPAACTTLTCDTFTLTVNVPATFYAANPTYAVRVGIQWDSLPNDFDLYVKDAAGNVVSQSGQSLTTSELVDLGQLASGTYTVQVVAFSTVNEPYTGSAVLAPEPTDQTRVGRYKTGKFSFSSPLLLPGTPGPLGQAQGVEPRVAHDALGNIYVAAIQGVPAGVDVWKSMDGGATFTYLGEPDGAQAAAAIGVRGAGAGGGDEDLAISTNGAVYMNSLWIGSATQASSTNGGTTWTANPVSSDTPIIDRQWIAAHGANELYLTFKQLGVLLVGTESIFVAKSFDGGITFPQIVEVTTPEVGGVQPGLQGNIAVDPANGAVYNVFVGAKENQLYLSKSTDGGRTWMLKLVYSAPSGTSVGNVFPSLALDAAGHPHVVFSDGHNIYLTSSADGGATWTAPIRVSNGADTKTSLGPWVTAGASGKLDIVWWGTASASNMDANADWKVFMAQTSNAFDRNPTFSQAAATGVMHTGAICTNGTGCATGTRNLAEYFAHDFDLNGLALIAYPDDKHGSSSAVTYFVRQVSGTTVK